MADLTRLTAWTILLAAATTSLADPGDAPKESPGDAWMNTWMLDGDKATQKIQQEIEKVRQELGSEYSLESKELGISFDRTEAAPKYCQEETTSKPSNSPSQEGAGIDAQLLSISQKTQEQARHLEQLAADAETRMDYQQADRLREIARQQWQAARLIRMPASNDAQSCSACSGNTLELHDIPPTAPFSTTIPPGVNGPGPGVLFPFFSPWNVPAPHSPLGNAPAK